MYRTAVFLLLGTMILIGAFVGSTYSETMGESILQANEFPAGSQELTVSGLKNIQIQEKDGPKPLATSTLVQVVGCMSMLEEPDGVIWMLGRASEPLRTRNSDKATPEELKDAET